MNEVIINTPLGCATIKGDGLGVQSITVSNEQLSLSTNISDELKSCVFQLEEYFNGNLNTFNFKMNPKGTEFQKKVWDALLEIPYGKTVSYLDLSKKLGNVKAIRAVASANGKNPLWVAIPCHRVIGSDGSLTGYASGLHRKKWLLDHENPVKQQSLF